MRTSGVFNILGKLLLLLSLFMLLPIPFSFFFNDGMAHIFLLCSIAVALLGALLVAVFLPDRELGFRDGFAVVSFSWLAMALLGALPYYFSGRVPSVIDCIFESMSGFTTTGSTILSKVEVLAPSLLFWRSLTNWLGGMGFIVLSNAVLPLLGGGGMQLFHAETPGPAKDRLAPRIKDTAGILWIVYVLFTAVETGLLMAGGVPFFDALCHSFATLSTGGFSPHTANIGFFHSAYVEWVIIVFMFIAGVNFTLHHQCMMRRKCKAFWQSEEFRLYVSILLFSTGLILIFNAIHQIFPRFGDNIRATVFQVVSITTTTGFGSADFRIWPPVCQVLLIALMFIGGCAGSTSGGIKVFRILLFFKYARLQFHNLVHPHAVSTIRMGKIRVPREVKIAIHGYLSLYLAVFLFSSLIITACGVDIITGATAVIATLNNVGPGLHLVGAANHFGHLPDSAKIVLSVCMLVGRLELYPVAVLLTPAYWAMSRTPVFRWQDTVRQWRNI